MAWGGIASPPPSLWLCGTVAACSCGDAVGGEERTARWRTGSSARARRGGSAVRGAGHGGACSEVVMIAVALIR